MEGTLSSVAPSASFSDEVSSSLTHFKLQYNESLRIRPSLAKMGLVQLARWLSRRRHKLSLRA